MLTVATGRMLMSFAVSTSYFYLCLQAFQFKQMHIWYALDRVYTKMITTHNSCYAFYVHECTISCNTPIVMMQSILYLDAIVDIGLLF